MRLICALLQWTHYVIYITPEVLEIRMKQLQVMQTQLSELKTSLSETLKEAEISDPSITADI